MKGNRAVRVLISAVLVVSASGCASQSDESASVAERVVPGLPETWDGPAPDLISGNPTVGWLTNDEFGVVTVSSSSCPPVAVSFDVAGRADVRIAFEESSQDPCTADMGATTHIFQMPGEVDRRPVVITIFVDSVQMDSLLLQ